MTSAMELTGRQHLGSASEAGGAAGEPLQAVNPATGQSLPGTFAAPSDQQVDHACKLALAAAPAYAALPPEQRAAFLEAVAEELEAAKPALVERAGLETGLPPARLGGELARAAGQFRLYAGVLRAGQYLDVRMDTPLPDRKPLPRPALATMRVPIGPIAVFGASNFPMAYSAAGGDTASALAAGCPVVARAHPAHPGAAELAGSAVLAAAVRTGMPEGVYSLLTGPGNALGEALVQHPAIAGVGFTGSRKGGLALAALAAARPRPIPVFAEMSSVNPVFVLPGALAERGAQIGEGLAASVLLGVGQFCTNPGLVFALEGPGWDDLLAAVSAGISAAGAGTMLHAGIAKAYAEGASALRDIPGVETVAQGDEKAGCTAQPQLCVTTAEHFLAAPAMAQEVFGPASLLVRCRSFEQMLQAARGLEGQLTATLHFADADQPAARTLLPLLAEVAGRLIANGFPTGVEVGTAMVHGGPYPATTDSRWTAVGSMAIERWLRPVCFQGFPDALLPEALQSTNPLGLPRRVDSERG